MPLYDYVCDRDGPFRDWRPMRLCGQAMPCPTCGRAAKRAIATPHLACVPRAVRIAHERNERSAEQPNVMRREELHATGRARAPAHRHGSGQYRRSMLGHAH
jgi:putative FmdB family regulatory protein